MDVREKLVELICDGTLKTEICTTDTHLDCETCRGDCGYCTILADHLIANSVTVQECAYWQYIVDDVDEDNNIQAYCSVCGAGDKHATSMIGKVPYCWKCGRKMMPQPPKGE